MTKSINNILDTDKMTTVQGFPELKLRRWIETSTESEVVDHKLIIEDMNILKATYEVKSNEKSLQKAINKINLFNIDDIVFYKYLQYYYLQTYEFSFLFFASRYYRLFHVSFFGTEVLHFKFKLTKELDTTKQETYTKLEFNSDFVDIV